MDKRYQVFVSSTYADLKEERQKVLQTLMEMDCIPSGMELFPAADEEQWQFIKKVIDDCDYYLLILGGRYGTVDSNGVSYTEKEYQYAIEKGIKIIALIIDDPGQVTLAKSDGNDVLRERLRKFRVEVEAGRLVKYWKTSDELPGLVALSLSKTIKTHPAVGWVRADKVSNEEVLSEINQVRKENFQLRQELTELRSQQYPPIQNLASLDDKMMIRLTYTSQNNSYSKVLTRRWCEIFALIAPYLLAHPQDLIVSKELTDSLAKEEQIKGAFKTLDDQDFQTIKIQLSALALIEVNYLETTKGGMGLFWSLTEAGHSLMMELRTKKAPASVQGVGTYVA